MAANYRLADKTTLFSGDLVRWKGKIGLNGI